MIGRLVNAFLDTAPPETIWGDVLPELLKTDFNLINLEAALTACEEAVPKVFNFKADPSKVEVLSKARIDVVNLANNHVLDYTEAGLLETLETLDRADIMHVGAGCNREEARKPVILRRKEITFGIIGYTDNEPGWKAEKNKPGVHYIEVGDLAPISHHLSDNSHTLSPHLVSQQGRSVSHEHYPCPAGRQSATTGERYVQRSGEKWGLETVLDDIKPLEARVDVLIVSLHWGPNMREHPSRQFVDFAHALIDNGVDIIHGHSAHIFQRFEEYHGGLILYDTGDFVDDYYVDPLLHNDRSFLFLVQVSKEGYQKLELIPVKIEDFCVQKAKGREAEKIFTLGMLKN